MEEDIGELIDELNKLRINDPSSYRKRLREIRMKNPGVYRQIAEILDIKKIRTPTPSSEMSVFPSERRKKKEKGGNNMILIISALSLVGLFMGIIMIVFISGLSGEQKPSEVEPVNAINLGYELMFNSSQTKYLRYRFTNNISVKYLGERTFYYEGQEYLSYSKNKFVTAQSYNKYLCNGECEHKSFNQTIFGKTGDSIIYDVDGENMRISFPDSQTILPASTLIYFSELKYVVENELYDEADSYEIGEIAGVECAPIRFRITSSPPTTLELPENAVFNEMFFETCLSNEGVPIAIGRYVEYRIGNNIYEKTFFSELVTAEESLIKPVSIDGRTITEWYGETSFSEANPYKEGVFIEEFPSLEEEVVKEKDEEEKEVEILNQVDDNYVLGYDDSIINVFKGSYEYFSTQDLNNYRSIHNNCPNSSNPECTGIIETYNYSNWWGYINQSSRIVISMFNNGLREYFVCENREASEVTETKSACEWAINNITERVEPVDLCVPSWNCGRWSSENGMFGNYSFIARSCVDTKNCKEFTGKPDEIMALNENVSISVNTSETEEVMNISYNNRRFFFEKNIENKEFDYTFYYVEEDYDPHSFEENCYTNIKLFNISNEFFLAGLGGIPLFIQGYDIDKNIYVELDENRNINNMCVGDYDGVERYYGHLEIALPYNITFMYSIPKQRYLSDEERELLDEDSIYSINDTITSTSFNITLKSVSYDDEGRLLYTVFNIIASDFDSENAEGYAYGVGTEKLKSPIGTSHSGTEEVTSSYSFGFVMEGNDEIKLIYKYGEELYIFDVNAEDIN